MADVTLKAILMGEDRSLSRTMNKAGDSVEDVGKKSKTTGQVMKGALSASVIEHAASAIMDFGRDSIEAYQGAERSQRQLEDAYRRFPALQDVAIGKMRDQAKAIQDKVGADADDIASGQAVLARYKLTGKQLQQMTPLLVDYATRTGKDIPSAAQALGKGILGSGRAMKELGINFKDAKDPAKNFEQIMAGLREKVGGFAEGEAGTLDGKLNVLKARFGDVQESIGEQLLPVVIQLAEGASQLVGWIQQNANWLGPLATLVGALAAQFLIMNAILALNPFILVTMAIIALVGSLLWAYNNVGWFRDAVDAAFNAIGAVARWLWNNAFRPAIQAIVRGFAWVIDGIANFLDALGNIPGFGWAKTAAAGLRGLANSARSAADGIKDIPDPKVNTDPAKKRVDSLKAKISSIKGKIVEAKAKGDDRAVVSLRNKLNSLRKRYDIALRVYKTGLNGLKVTTIGSRTMVQRLAMGGPARQGMPYWVGENGPELFWPGMNGHINNQFQLQNAMRAGGSTSNTATTNYYVTLNTPAGAPNAWAAEAEKALVQLMRSRGPGGKLQFQKA